MNRNHKAFLLLSACLFPAATTYAYSANSISDSDVGFFIGLLILVLVIFVFGPLVLSIASLRSGSRNLNIAAWIVAGLAKVLTVLLSLSGRGVYQYGALTIASLVPNISLVLLIARLERSLSGHRFIAAYLTRVLLLSAIFMALAGSFPFVSIRHNLDLSTLGILFLLIKTALITYMLFELLKQQQKKGFVVHNWQQPLMWGVIVHFAGFLSGYAQLLRNPQISIWALFSAFAGVFPYNIIQFACWAVSGLAAWLLWSNYNERAGN